MAISNRLSKYEKPLKQQKILECNTEEKPRTKVVETYNDTLSYRQYPVSETFIRKLAEDFVLWARNDDRAVRLDQFYLSKNIAPKTFERWTDKFPVLMEAFLVAKSYIAIRRETGVIFKDGKLNPSALYQMHQYDEAWKSGEEWKAKLSQATSNESNIKVVMEAFPSSPLVPEKKREVDE